MESPNTSKEKTLLANLEKIQKKQLEVNSRLMRNYNSKDDKLNSVLSKSIDDMQKKLVTSLQNNNKAVIKDFTRGVDKNINYAFGEQADDIINVLKAQQDTIKDVAKPQPLPKVFLNKLSNVNEESIDYFKNSVKDVAKPQPLPKVFLNKLSNVNEESVDYFKNSVKDVFDSVMDSLKGHFNDIFGPIYDNLVAPLVGIGKSLFEFSKSTLGLFGGDKEDKNASITANTLLWIKDFYEDERKRELRTGDEKEKGLSWLGFLGVAVMTLGGIIGALARRFTLFFEIFQIQKLGIVKKVIGFFAVIGQTIGGWLDDAIKSVAKIPKVGKFVAAVMEEFMKFFPAVAKGFTKLAWPLTIFLGAIDFIRGFMSEEGNILDKIQGGLKKAIDGFIDLPVKLLGFIGDKILSLFGVEIEGGIGEKMRSYILGMSDIFMMPLRIVSDFFTGFFESEEDAILGRLKDGLFGVFDGLLEGFENIFSFVSNLFDFENLKNSIFNKVKKIPGAGWFLKDKDEKEEIIKTISGGRGRTPGFMEHGTKDFSEKGGPIGLVPSEKGGPISPVSSGGIQNSSFISLLREIKNVLKTRLFQIVNILTQDNISSKIISGMSTAVKSASSKMGSFFSSKSDDKKPDYNEIVGVDTQLTEVPGSSGTDWEDPMGKNKRITSRFGGRIHPVTGKMQGHKGLDMAGPEPGMYGYPIKASKDGMVSIASRLRGYGNVVYIDHEDGYQTRYAHLQNFNVRPGDPISAGQVIGGMGNTGVGTGPHLHYEVRKDGKALNPEQVLSARDGAMIRNQSSEMGIPAEVHPNEAILPLNNSILSILGEKIARFVKYGDDTDISNNKLSGTNYDNILSDNSYEYMSRLNNNAITSQKEMNKTFLNNLRQLIGDLKESQQDSTSQLTNNMSNFLIDSSRNITSENEPPDQIENGLLLIMNSAWGVG